MTTYIVRRVLLVVPTLAFAFTAVFILLRLIPGDAVTVLFSNGQYSKQDYQEFRHQLGIDQSIPVQYGKFATQIVTGDFGKSIFSGRQVLPEFFQNRLSITVELTVFAVVFGLLLGIPAGVAAALKHDSVIDHIVRSVAIGGLAIPGFWIATLVLVLPSHWWHWAPPLGYKSFFEAPGKHLEEVLIPSFIMSIALAAALMRMTRAMMLEVLRQDFVRTARAKGLHSNAIIVRHALRNAMIPLVSVLGVQVAVLISGTVIFETIFSLPGVGSYLFQGVTRRDYPVVQVVAVFLTVGVALINLLVDLSYPLIDPRVRV